MNNTTKKTHILDVKVPYDDYSLFMANRVDNSKKYKDLQIHSYLNTTLCFIIIHRGRIYGNIQFYKVIIIKKILVYSLSN